MDAIATQDRMRGAIWGELVGDGAALGAHWYYDLTKLKSLFSEGIRGFETPKGDHYHKNRKSGDFTHYGDAALLMLESVAERQSFSEIDFGTRFFKLFTDPNYKGYLDKATKETINNFRARQEQHPDFMMGEFQNGANDDQPGTITRIAPVVVAHWDDPHLMNVIEKATKVTQNNEVAIAYTQCFARILRSLLQGFDLGTAIEQETVSKPDDTPIEKHTRQSIIEAIQLSRLSVTDATFKLGQSCPLEKSFPSAVHAALKFRDSFPEAILETIRAGGDSAARCAIVGTWLGAYLGVDRIPDEWRRRLTHYNKIDQCVEKIVETIYHNA